MRLAEGRYRHPRCPACIEPPAQRQHTMPGRRWILRRRWCNDRLVDFSLLLQVEDDDGVWVDVCRFSVAHANSHALQHHRATPKTQVYTSGTLDTVDDVEQAYRLAVRWAYPSEDIYVRRWQEGPP